MTLSRWGDNENEILMEKLGGRVKVKGVQEKAQIYEVKSKFVYANCFE